MGKTNQIKNKNTNTNGEKKEVKLIWGGRPFKQRVVKSNIPNTTLLNGVVTLDNKTKNKFKKLKRGESTKNGELLLLHEEIPMRTKNNGKQRITNKERDTTYMAINYDNKKNLRKNHVNKEREENSLDFTDSDLVFHKLDTDGEQNYLESGIQNLQGEGVVQVYNKINDEQTEEKENQEDERNYISIDNDQMVQNIHFTINPSFSTQFDTINFFIKESCRMFVPTTANVYENNPFITIFPSLIFKNPSLINLVLIFGANQKERMFNPFNKKMVMEQELNDEITKILKTLSSPNTIFSSLDTEHNELDDLATICETNKLSNSFLCSILLLSCICFHFPNTHWKFYLDLFKKVLNEKYPQKRGRFTICTEHKIFVDDNRDKDYYYKEGKDDNNTNIESNFIMNWFNYLDVVSTLSSVTNTSSNNFSANSRDTIQYTYNLSNLDDARYNLKDIEYFSGVDMHVMYYLNNISKNIAMKNQNSNQNSNQHSNQHSNQQQQNFPHETLENDTVLLLNLDLKKNLESYLIDSERQRDYIEKMYYSNQNNTAFQNSFSSSAILLENYKSLRATNLLFGLNGLLQLNRRVLNMPSFNIEIKSLLYKCICIIRENIRIGSPSSQCVLSCLFTVGCDLVDNELVPYRDVILQRMDALVDRGVSAALEAKEVMKTCWLYTDKKNWWEIMLEQNIDISFCL